MKITDIIEITIKQKILKVIVKQFQNYILSIIVLLTLYTLSLIT